MGPCAATSELGSGTVVAKVYRRGGCRLLALVLFRFPNFWALSSLPRRTLGKWILSLLQQMKRTRIAPSGEKIETGWVITFIRGPGKHVGDCAPEDGADNSEDDRPEDRHVRVHH